MIVALSLVVVFAPQDPPATAPDLPAELTRLVDLPTARARRDAADALAKRSLAPIDAWLAACSSFGTFAPMAAGPTRHDVPLRVLDQIEQTEVFLYVPVGCDSKKPAPLLLWGHGAGGTGAREYLSWQAVADRVGMFVLAITEFDREPGYHFSPRERAAQLAALRWARRQVNVDENAIFVGGWSRGGHLAWDLMLRHPDLFAGAVPVVGGPRLEIGRKNNLRYLENVAHLPILDLQGSLDDELLLANLRLAFARLHQFGSKQATLREFPDRGHDADLGVVDWPTFFGHRRQSRPPRAVRLAAEPDETRAFWLQVTGTSQRAAPDIAPDVRVANFDRLDPVRQREHLLDRYADYTARLSVEDKSQGRFVADGKWITSFALLLVPQQVGKDGSVEVRLQNKPVKKKVAPDLGVLLREFAERFDRTFLPVHRVQVP